MTLRLRLLVAAGVMVVLALAAVGLLTCAGRKVRTALV